MRPVRDPAVESCPPGGRPCRAGRLLWKRSPNWTRRIPSSISDSACCEQPVRSALNFLLHVRDLDWIIRDESVTITTRTAADQKLETAVYDVSNLVAEDNGLTDLIDAIQSTIEPSAWESLGGEGSLRAVGNLLVIRQSQRMHDEVALLLVKLGKVATKNSPQANGGAAGDQMSVKVYGVNRRGAAELADVITTILEPNSWKASGGEGVVRSVEDAIIVYQSARMHARVRRLLADLPNRVDSATNVGTQGQAGGFFQCLDSRQSSAPGRNRSQEPARQWTGVR